MEPGQLLGPDETVRVDPRWPLEVTSDLYRDFYQRMRLAQCFDDEALALQRQGELGLWLQSLGQEASQIDSITALSPDDYVFPSYREQAAALCRGITPAELLVQWRGNRHSGWDPADYRFHIYTLVLAAQLLHATGYAMGVERDGTEEIVAVYFGDGSNSQGEANEAFNWAAAAEVPLLFFCQNNQWAISTPTPTQMRAPLHQRARGFGLDAHLVDGNDVLAVHAVTRAVADQIRAGGGPAEPGARTAERRREAPTTRVPVKGVRKATAAAMVGSAFTAPHVTEFVTVDVTRSVKLIEKLRTERALEGFQVTMPTARGARSWPRSVSTRTSTPPGARRPTRSCSTTGSTSASPRPRPAG